MSAADRARYTLETCPDRNRLHSHFRDEPTGYLSWHEWAALAAAEPGNEEASDA